MAGVAAGNTLVIEGTAGRRVINGAIRVNGSKNDAVQAIAAVFLFKNGLALTNLPEIDDVQKMLLLAENLDARATIRKRTALIRPPRVSKATLDTKLAEKIRASILLTGPLLARYGSVTFPHPGGCVIGERPIDLFLDGFARLGARTTARAGIYHLTAPLGHLHGAEIFFRQQTVTATECFLLTAIIARGRTVLKNCALEPEITSLGAFLIRQGARIKGLGTTTLVIDGGPLLTSKNPSYTIIPDRIEAGSFLIFGALLARGLTITDCEPRHLDSVIALLRYAGAAIEVGSRRIIVRGRRRQSYRALVVKTHEYPGFPTDLQALISVFLTQAKGESRLFETIFEGRLGHLETLTRMGAKINIHNQHQATIVGPTPLVGREVISPDLRAGLAYLLAGLVAKGRTVVHNVHYIDRGYERIDERLRALGLALKRF